MSKRIHHVWHIFGRDYMTLAAAAKIDTIIPHLEVCDS